MNTNDTTKEARLAASVPSFTGVTAPMKGDVEHSLKTWLSRPFRYGNFQYTTSTGANSELFAINIFKDLMSKPYYAEKLHGFYGLRATLHVRLQCNATRFDAGRLLLTYSPTVYDVETQLQLDRSLAARTQLPRVDLDINADSEVTLTVPYISDAPFYVFEGNSYAGHIAVAAYTAMRSTSNTQVRCTIFTHLTDVELFWPSFITPQSGINGGRVKRGNHSTEQVGLHRPVSSGLGLIKSGTKMLSTIPVVGQYIAPLSWAASVGQKLAMAMGYSKPPSHARQAVAVQYLNNMATSSGYDYSQPMGMMEDNSLQVCRGLGGSDLDHMDIMYPLSIPTYFATFNWSISDAAGTQKYTQLQAPGWYDVGLTNGFYQTTPLSFFSRLFSYYRGSINITVKIVKTEFHTGRLRLWYSPNSSPSEDNGDTNYLYSSIIDLKEANEFMVTIPYMGKDLYGTVRANEGATNWGITVINPLSAPTTVSSTVTVLMEVSAAPDFEFAVPRPSNLGYIMWATRFNDTVAYTTSPNWVTLNNITGELGDPDLVSLQGNYGTNPIGNAPDQEPSLVPSLLAIGERITSVKQLMQRSYPLGNVNRNGTFLINVDAPGISGGYNQNNMIMGNNNTFCLLRDCYAFYRGSVRFKMALADTSSTVRMNSFLANTQYTPGPGSAANCYPTVVSLGTNIASNSFGMVEVPANQGAVELSIPNYGRNPCRRSFMTMNKYDQGRSQVQKEARLVVIVPTGTGNYKGNTYLSAGDDFQLGLWVCSPTYSASISWPAYSDLDPVIIPKNI